MMLKKQTVWLLTMLSLIIVLSVYYMTSPGPSPSDQLAFTTDDQQKQKSGEEKKKTEKSKNEAGATNEQGSAATNIASEEVFALARLKAQDSRNQLMEQYTQVIASDSASAEEQAAARDKINQLQQLSSKEKTLESLIVAKGYKDALVNANDGKVQVVVKADKLSNKQANEIMDLVYNKLQYTNVAVSYSPENQ